jgi:hypothetical protein
MGITCLQQIENCQGLSAFTVMTVGGKTSRFET